MALTKDEEAAIRGVIKRLSEDANASERVLEVLRDRNVRIYLDTWVVSALQLILPGPERNPALARRLAP